MYKTVVKAIGAESHLFREENMLILFGLNAPEELKDYCYNIEVTPVTGMIEVGQVLVIGTNRYKITAVGDVVVKNLSGLGHMTIKFDGARTAELPGTLHVESGVYPTIDFEMPISIEGS